METVLPISSSEGTAAAARSPVTVPSILQEHSFTSVQSSVLQGSVLASYIYPQDRVPGRITLFFLSAWSGEMTDQPKSTMGLMAYKSHNFHTYINLIDTIVSIILDFE